MDCSMPGFPVHHHLPEFAQVRVHCIGNDIQPAHPLSSPSSPAIILSQHQGLFQIQFSSVTQPWLTLCNPMNRSMPGLPVHHNSQSPPKPISIALVMPSNHLILCHPLLLLPSNFPSIKVFSNESIIRTRWPKYWSLASTSVLPMNTQDWLPLGWTGWISLKSKGLSRVFSNTTVQKHQFFGAQLSSQSNSHIHSWPLGKPYPWLDGPLLTK